ncbi:MAG: dihydropteroate synthase, partial [Spirochaetota bacterium]|nr:dihydropteroate synthase [Spirochaetota bacterium]
GLSSTRGHVFLKPGTPVKVIGERINPTGKKKFQEALREGRFEEIKRFAVEQEASGADLLDVNVGMSGIDEAAVMMQAVAMLSTSSKLPLVIDSSNPEIIAKALRLYPGRALINSISLEKIKEPLLEVAAKYGAMFILLPLSDEEVPATAAGRIENTKKLLARAEKLGFTKDDIVVDCITMTVSSEQRAGLETLEFVRWCAKDLGVNTTMGLSNVSFGLPERKWVNGAFLAMCVYNGLSSAIANPNELVLMNLKYASDVLTLNDKGSMLYVSNVVKTDMTPGDGGNGKKERAESNSVFDCVVNGEKEIIVDRVKKMLDSGVEADEIINKHLIPGINKVGELYEAK